MKDFAAGELKEVLPIEAQAKAHRLPVLDMIREYRETLANYRSEMGRLQLHDHWEEPTDALNPCRGLCGSAAGP